MSPGSSETGELTVAKRAKKKTSGKKKKTKPEPEPENDVPDGAVVLWHEHRNRRVSTPVGAVRFVDHELVIDPDELGPAKAKALLDYLWEHGYRTEPTEAKATKPKLG